MVLLEMFVQKDFTVRKDQDMPPLLAQGENTSNHFLPSVHGHRLITSGFLFFLILPIAMYTMCYLSLFLTIILFIHIFLKNCSRMYVKLWISFSVTKLKALKKNIVWTVLLEIIALVLEQQPQLNFVIQDGFACQDLSMLNLKVCLLVVQFFSHLSIYQYLSIYQ